MFEVKKQTDLNSTAGNVILIYADCGTDQAKGFILQHNGKHAICINTSFPEEIQRCVFCHELMHLKLNHINRLRECNSIEYKKLQDQFEKEAQEYCSGSPYYEKLWD